MNEQNPFNETNLTIEERADLYEAIVNSNLDSVVAIDINGNIIEWNRAAEDLFLYSDKEAEGQNIKIIIPKSDREHHDTGMDKYKKTGEGPILNKRIEVDAIDKNGRQFPVELSISTIDFRNKKYFTSRIREITDRRKYETQLKLTAKEMAHREKNSLAIVSAIFRQIAKYSKNIEDFQKKFESWLMSYKQTHELLARDINSEMSMMERVKLEFSPYNNGNNIIVEGDDVMLKRHAALNFSLCLHETITNSIKHGALSVASGKIHFKSVVDDKNINLYWKETGGPKVKPPTHFGFGSQLLKYALMQGLGGYSNYTFPETGFEGVVVFPIERAKQK